MNISTEIGVFLRSAIRRVEWQIYMERMRPKIADKIEADLADPPERHILGVVGEANTDLRKFLDASVSLSGPRFDSRHKLWSGRRRSPGDRAE